MSILQDYETIRKEIGEEKYAEIERYLKFHPGYYLSDVYYKKSVWDEMEWWCERYPLEKFVAKPAELTFDFMQAIESEVCKYGMDILNAVQNFNYYIAQKHELTSVENFLQTIMKDIENYSIPVSVTQNSIGVFIQQRKYL